MRYTYPLQWPVGWPRNSLKIAAQFKVDYDQAVGDLGNELERLDAESGYISTDQELRVNGTPRRDRQPVSSDVAVYFVRNGKQLCIPCDKFWTVRDNIRAIGLTLEAIRRMERYGTSQMVEATLAGFAALPAHATEMGSGPKAWHEVLQVAPNADKEVIRASYRSMAAKYHPDNASTGNPGKFAEVQRAYDEVRGS